LGELNNSIDQLVNKSKKDDSQNYIDINESLKKKEKGNFDE